MTDLEYLHIDDAFVVVCKPSGLLAVPGRGPENADCVTARVRDKFADCPVQPEAHRLDMDTSGLMLVARSKEAKRALSIQFQNRETDKRYVAILTGVPSEQSGSVVLRFRLDVDNRPHQIHDPVQGKLGITHWEVVQVEEGRARVLLHPVTGRTHQLRVHMAHELGVGLPIVGDPLYGAGTGPGKMLLHAFALAFTHPVNGERCEFFSPPPF